MTKGSNFPIIPLLEDLESTFHKKKDKKVDKSSSKFQIDKLESFENSPDNKGIGYEPKQKPRTIQKKNSKAR